MFLQSNSNEECCGCGACVLICPTKAISMKKDRCGFDYPSIDKDKCIGCKKCEKTCAFINNHSSKAHAIEFYAAKTKDKTIHNKSRSGGAFASIAQAFLTEPNSNVWGAAFDERLRVVHTCIDRVEDIPLLQGSKYVQSEIGDAFERVFESLNAGQNVLFSGTACQVAGLYSYLRMNRCDTRSLTTCDIVCQGVPSPKVYREYLSLLNEKHHSPVVSFNFRDKNRIGWSGHEESFLLENGKKIYSRTYSNYYYDYFMRPSCFSCPYTGLERPADFTLGDFWGVKEKYPAFYDRKGVSIIIINSDKGKKEFQNVIELMDVIPIKENECIQPRLKEPCKCPENYGQFWSDYVNNGISYCFKKYSRENLKDRILLSLVALKNKIVR